MTHPTTIWLDSVDSTNAHALTNFDSLPDASLVAARTQTAGRGRRGRRWLSPQGGLYATFLAKNARLNPLHAQAAAALATLDTIIEAAPAKNWKLKWPNDVCLFLDSAILKVAGILSEVHTPTASNTPDGVAVGIGVNLNASSAELARLEKPATSMAIETGESFDTALFAEKLLPRIRRRVAESTLHPDRIIGEWKKKDGLLGRQITAEIEDGPILAGTALDIARDGALILKLEDGTLKQLTSGDVSIAKIAEHNQTKTRDR